MVEGARLESVCASDGTQGSNPCLSAINQKYHGQAIDYSFLCHVSPWVTQGCDARPVHHPSDFATLRFPSASCLRNRIPVSPPLTKNSAVSAEFN